MLRRLIAITIFLSLVFVIGCASTPEVVRYSLLSSPREILTSNRFVIAPASVMHQYVSSGDIEIDSYLKDNSEIWQVEVAAQLKNRLNEKGFKAEIVHPQPGEFKEKLKNVLKQKGREAFYISKNLDLNFYNSVMSELAVQYNATIIVPTLIIKTVYAKQGTIGGSIKAKWDGVFREVLKQVVLKHCHSLQAGWI